MRARKRAPTPQLPLIIPAVALESSSASLVSIDSDSALSAQLREHDLKMTVNFYRMEYRVDNDL